MILLIFGWYFSVSMYFYLHWVLKVNWTNMHKCWNTYLQLSHPRSWHLSQGSKPRQGISTRQSLFHQIVFLGTIRRTPARERDSGGLLPGWHLRLPHCLPSFPTGREDMLFWLLSNEDPRDLISTVGEVIFWKIMDIYENTSSSQPLHLHMMDKPGLKVSSRFGGAEKVLLQCWVEKSRTQNYIHTHPPTHTR